MTKLSRRAARSIQGHGNRSLLIPLWFRLLHVGVLISLLVVTTPKEGAHVLALSSTTKASSSSAKSSTLTSLNTKPLPWTYQGYSIYAEVTEPSSTSSSSSPLSSLALNEWSLALFGDGDGNKQKSTTSCSVVLIHGFGCSTYYWRETCRALSSAGYTVHAIDLLGLGKSAKPDSNTDGVVYSTELWSNLVLSYVQDNIPSHEPLVFIGNSLGSVVALSAAVACPEQMNERVRGVGMFNCGVGMNSMNLLKDPSLTAVQRALFGFVFQVLNTLLFGNGALITFVLDKVVTKDLLRNALLSLYACAANPDERVDDDLVDSFYSPAKDAGSPQALSQIYVNDAGPTPMELHESGSRRQLGKEIPIHVIWGNQDAVTPLTGNVGQYYTKLAADASSSVTMHVVNAGHIPFDEVPECNDSMVAWMNNVVMVQ
jgi:pimeloyl-ACP methyl ester carboxylesterase